MSGPFLSEVTNRGGGGGGGGSPLTTKGDLFTYSTSDARLPVGSNGQVLVADSSATDGIKWAAISGTGDVVGPASANAGEIALFDGATGKLIKAATGSGIVKVSSGVYSAAALDLTADVTGVLPVANGGTNSSTSLNSNRFMVSSGGKVVEAAAVTASRAVASDSNGLPVASATTATELGYVNGVTSAIQTQINTKAPAASPTFSGTITTPLTASRAVAVGASNELVASATTATELGYVNGVTSAIQTQINTKAPAASPTFSGTITTPLTASKAVVTGASNELAASATTATEIGYVSGVTSAIQTQLDGKQATLTIPVTVANGGTNSSTALNSNRFVVSSGGKIVEAAAVTASRAVASDSNGLPVASATTAAELAFVNGVTSAIQTQINTKAPSASPTFTGSITTPLTASRIVVTDGSSILAANAALTAYRPVNSTAAGALATPGLYDAGNTSTAITFDMANSLSQKATNTGNATISFSNLSAGQHIDLFFTQDGTGSRTMSFSNVTWYNSTGTAPAAGGIGKLLWVHLFCLDGTNFAGNYVGNY